MTKFTKRQIENYREYERIRQSGAFNMLDPNARAMTGMDRSEWAFVLKNYSALRGEAKQEDSE